MVRLEKLAEVFYTYVGDLQSLASTLELDVDAVDMVYHYWLLKRKVAASTSVSPLVCSFTHRLLEMAYTYVIYTSL